MIVLRTSRRNEAATAKLSRIPSPISPLGKLRETNSAFAQHYSPFLSLPPIFSRSERRSRDSFQFFTETRCANWKIFNKSDSEGSFYMQNARPFRVIVKRDSQGSTGKHF